MSGRDPQNFCRQNLGKEVIMNFQKWPYKSVACESVAERRIEHSRPLRCERE